MNSCGYDKFTYIDKENHKIIHPMQIRQARSQHHHILENLSFIHLFFFFSYLCLSFTFHFMYFFFFFSQSSFMCFLSLSVVLTLPNAIQIEFHIYSISVYAMSPRHGRQKNNTNIIFSYFCKVLILFVVMHVFFLIIVIFSY